jgi:hypothetical protein
VAAQTRVARIEVDRSQEEINRWQALSDREQARQQAQCDRLEAVRERMQARIAQQAAHIRIATFAPISVKVAPVVCPRIRVNVPRVPMIKMPAMPEIHIEASAGPV